VTLRRLGKSDVEISPLGLGCWQFSEGSMGLTSVGWYWPALEPAVVDAIVQRSLKGGINWFDTAEAYGDGRSERQTARALQAAGKKPGEVVIATKWNPAGRFASSIGGTIDERLACLAPYPIDLHQVHQPMGFSSVEAEMQAMGALVKAGKIRSVGVSNFNQQRMRRAHAELATLGLPLAANQVRYNLLDRKIERSGLIAAAKELGVTIIAYSPLEQGLLSGKFHDDPSLVKNTGVRRFLPQFRNLAKSQPLINELKAIAKAYGATPSQVALAWMLQFHGDTVVAIPGASKEKHADENVGAMGLKLTQAELQKIDQLAQ
jgi:aryl-alcohol dehydrogenase-like predicted oxidoreductase